MQVSSLGQQDTNTQEGWAWQGKIYASNGQNRTRQGGRIEKKTYRFVHIPGTTKSGVENMIRAGTAILDSFINICLASCLDSKKASDKVLVHGI